MARKRVNKNLVAFLTVMGILLAVAVVTIATGLGAAKDPEVWATEARDREASGDFELAIDLFGRAYRRSLDVSYLAEAAECAYRYGEVGQAMGILQRAYNEQRSDPGAPAFKRVVVSYLDHLWDVASPQRYGRLGPSTRDSLLEFAVALQAADDQDVLGPLSEAVAQFAKAGEDPTSAAKGEAALQRALELDENNPRVVLTRIEHQRRQVAERINALRQDGALESEWTALADEFDKWVLERLTAGAEANPGDWRLVGAYVSELQAQDKFDAARAVLERAIAEREDVPELHADMARLLLQEARRQRAELAPEAYAGLIDGAVEHVRRAIELAPGMYQAYVTWARAEISRGLQESDVIAPERYAAALEIYDNAIQDTAAVRGLHARLGAGVDRPLLYVYAYNTAVDHFVKAATAAERQECLELVHRFLEYAESRYDKAAFTHYMRGQTYLAESQFTPALQAFQLAEEGAAADRSGLYPAMWFQAFGGVLPAHRIAQLYKELDQPGEALRYVDLAVERYRQLRPGELAPFQLMLDRVDLLVLLGKPPQETLDFVAEVRRAYAEELAAAERESVRLRLTRAEADALRRLERGGEGMALIERTGGEGVRAKLLQATLANQEQDYDAVESLTREVLDRDDLTAELAVPALRLLIPVLASREDFAAAKQVVAEMRGRFGSHAPLTHLLDQYDMALEYRDSDELNAKLLELIAAEPDRAKRARQYFDHYVGRRQYDQAAPYLDELEAAQPDEPEILENQFALALQREQYDRAGEYVVKLTALNDGRGADDAAGATYRAQLAFARGQAEDAVREYREAQARLPRSARLQVNLGRALLAANRVEEAVEALTEAVELNPRDFQANILLDDTLLRRVPAGRRPEGWEQYLERAGSLRPRHQYVLEHADRLNPQAGIATREERRAQNPEDVDNLIRLAQLYANKKVGDEVRAAERFQEALQLDPGNVQLAKAAAAFYSASGRREAGESHLRAYTEAQSGKQKGYAHALLGDFYSRLGDLQAAEGSYERARQVVEQLVQDPDERRQAMVDVELELIRFYRSIEGQEAKMIVACRWVLDKLSPDSELDAARIQFARLTIIRGLLGLQNLGDADKELTAYAADYPDDPGAALYQAQLKLLQRDWDVAYEALSRVLGSSPNHVWALLKRGALSVHYGRYEEGREDLVRARALTKDSMERVPEDRRRNSPQVAAYLDTCSALASLYEITEQYELAESELREMMTLIPDNPGAGHPQELVAQRLLQLYRRAGRPEKSQEIVSEFMARHPDQAFWPLQFGALHANRGDEFNRSADAAQEAGRTSDEERYRELAEEAYGTAATYYDRAAELVGRVSPGADTLYRAYQLDALAAAGETERALELFQSIERTLEKVPAALHAAMIRVYESDGQRDQALASLQRALLTALPEGPAMVKGVMDFASDQLPAEPKLDALRRIIDHTPADTRAGLYLRNVYAMQLLNSDRNADVLQTLEPVIAKAEPESAERLTALLVRAQALQQSGDIQGSLDLLEAVLKEYPDNRVALNSLAFVLADEAGRPQEALPYAERAREQSPRDAAILDTVGWVYFKNGRFEQAEAALKETLSVDAESPAAYYHLGMLYVELGRVAEARQTFRRALEAGDKSSKHKYDEKIREELDRLR